MDQRQLCSLTASRLLHQAHPRKITTHATLTSLSNAVNMVPGKDQMRANKLGDAYSKKEGLNILETVCEEYDAPVVALKKGVESLYVGRMAKATAKHRKAMATRLSIRGFSFYVDNVGRVSDFLSFWVGDVTHFPLSASQLSIQCWNRQRQCLSATVHAAGH